MFSPALVKIAKSLACAPAIVLTLAVADTSFAAPLKKPELDTLAATFEASPPSDFAAFLAAAAKTNPTLAASVAAYDRKTQLGGDDLTNVSRLLGLYNRLRNLDAVITDIEQMVALPTVRDDKTPPHEHPAILAFGTLVETMAKNFGLRYRNVDNRIFEVTLPGTGAEEFGILTHADVVPVIADEWVLTDGTKLDPFKVTRVGDLLYGRGTIDDKGSIAAALYAMKAVKESGLSLERSIRLMIETTEETGGDGMKYYMERTKLPEYNVVLDSKYPAVVAEKGSGALTVRFPMRVTDDNGIAVVALSAAASANTIPQTARATIKGADLTTAVAALEAARDGFISKYQNQGGSFAIDFQKGEQSVDLKVTGTSAHGSRPEEGVNPLPRLALFLRESGLTLADNHYAKAIRYLNDLYGTDYLGETMGVGYADEFMGPLTMSPTLVRESGDRLEVTANVRMPRGRTPDELKRAIVARIDAWEASNKIPLDITYNQGDWMARDPKGAWLAALLDIFGGVTGLDAKPVPTAGSTTAKLLPNAINFGPAMPGKKYTAHNANEYKEVADLGADVQMFTEMMVRLGNLKRMQ